MFKINKPFLIHNKPYFITALILFAAFIAYYSLILYLRIGTDVQVHADMSLRFFEARGNITPNFLYYFFVGLLAGFSKYKIAYYVSSVFLLSAAIVFKFLVNVFYIKRFTTLSNYITILLAIMLLFVFSLPAMNFFRDKNFYLGQLTPNVWHNSTVIFLFPFSIILFFETIYLFSKEKSSVRQKVFVFILIILNAVIKPSFLFSLIPAVFILCSYRFFKFGFKKSFYFLLPYLGGLFFIALEYFLIYKLNVQQSAISAKEPSSVIFSPFEMWSHFSANMPLAFITSCLFPLVYIFYTKGAVLKDPWVSFASINFLFAILIWILFIETGFRRYHGNFYWQVVIANYLLFFCMLIHLLQQVKLNMLTSKSKKIVFGVFTIHFVWGVIYWAKVIWFHGYS